MTIGIRASLSGRLCLYPHVIFSRKDDHFHLIFHFLCPRKQGQIIIHLHSFRAEPLGPAVLRHIPELARLYAAFAAPLHLFLFLHPSADPADPDLCQEPAHGKPPAVLRLQSPGEGEALFRIYCFFCKRYCQMSFQINGQKEHHRQQKELGQEEHHQRRALIHPCNIINTKKKGEKCKLRHLYQRDRSPGAGAPLDIRMAAGGAHQLQDILIDHILHIYLVNLSVSPAASRQ